MSDKILRALMQLFAIVANADRLTEKGREIVEAFLKQQLSQVHVASYLAVFDDYLKLMQGKSDPNKVKKRISVNSVKVLRICNDINSELNQKQKYIVLIRLIEFAYSSGDAISEQESEFLDIVGTTFNVSPEEYKDCLSLASGKLDIQNHASKFLLISNDKNNAHEYDKFIFHEGLSGSLYVLFIAQAGILFTRYFGEASLSMNSIPLLKNNCYIITQGSVIRGAKMLPLYYSDIIKLFMDSSFIHKLDFTVRDITFRFRNGKTGLHPINFSVSSGNLIGIMGGSGAGKSTLLNVLNTNLSPHEGEVLVNGINIHNQSDELEGLIGYVPQDDLLIEELTVFQNLFFNSKLCFGNLSDREITKKADSLLDSLGLFEIKNLKVGSPVAKTISGGQRKRLNIALELIREPAVLFVDEPTSGLSSRDSENVMDLLKQLSIGGTLIFVVIHQPSSDIFKLFDKLLILDIGGYPVYYGNPSDSLLYFKSRANFADAGESECYTCGNINPEQVFAIIESKVLDEFGNQTPGRKVSPDEWNKYYTEIIEKEAVPEIIPVEIPKPEFKKPSVYKQFVVFFKRDLLAKSGNSQYVLINLLGAPVLALFLSYFLRYRSGDTYVFYENINVAAFIFMSVIVALFIGLTVSAEEIIRDRKIRKREAFLNLSTISYLAAKVFILFFISAIQTALFVVIGNSIMGITGMFPEYWLMLFSVSCFANMLGLNISASFNEAVTIYILIPFLIIPQILMSGVMVKFDNMNPVVTRYDMVPGIGEVMTARWAFEALAVNQFKANDYEKLFFRYDMDVSNNFYKKDYWLVSLSDKLEESKRSVGIHQEVVSRNFSLLKNELNQEFSENANLRLSGVFLKENQFTQAVYEEIKNDLLLLSKYYIKQCNIAIGKREDFLVKLQKEGLTSEKLKQLENSQTNEYLSDLVLNNNTSKQIMSCDGQLIRKYRPVYMNVSPGSFIRAPFFVCQKMFFGKLYSTYWVNILVIWLMTFLMAVALYFNWLKKVLGLLGFKKSR